jgi:hypothetical protein
MTQEAPVQANRYWEALSPEELHKYDLALELIYNFNSRLPEEPTFSDRREHLGDMSFRLATMLTSANDGSRLGQRGRKLKDDLTFYAREVVRIDPLANGLYIGASELMPPRSAFGEDNDDSGRTIEREFIGRTPDGASAYQSIRKEGPTDEGTPGPITIH